MDGTDYDSAVAIVGMAGRFPGAADVAALWANSLSGTSGLRAISAAELAAAGIDPGPGYVAVGGPVAGGVTDFDATAFGFSDVEAEVMEPQHRLFLECSWEALESAGYRPTDPGGSVGVFAGCAFPDYMVTNVRHVAAEPGMGQLFATGNERDSLTSLVSYKLGLRGPSLTVQTFCSTSLVAVHLAVQSLLTYDCDLALAGGAHLPLPQPAGYAWHDGSILSPDGTVRPLSAAANGTVMGSGVGVVALKRMADALADGDLVHAVILGSAVNNDGRERAGYAAPGVEGQAAVVDAALAVAGVKPESVSYVECHAVGTPLGDSIELSALSRVFPPGRAAPLVLGSAKPLVGHLDRASGVTALIRAALALREATLPGTPGFDAPNPALAAQFTVHPDSRPWPAGDEPRRAGVSSFGVGGTNAHLVLEEPPPRERRTRPGPHLLTYSAGSPAALDALTDRLREHLSMTTTDDDLADVAYTLQVSRGRFPLRRAVVAADRADAAAALADPARWIDGETRRRDPAVYLVGDVPAGLADDLDRLGVRVAADRGDGVEEVPVLPDGMLGVLARAWLAGSTVDWAELHRGEGRRVELPPYPFQRSRHWVEAVLGRAARQDAAAPGRTFRPSWTPLPLPVADLDARLRAAGPWLVLSADARGEALVDRLAQAGAEFVTVRPGPEFDRDLLGDLRVRPEDLSRVLRSLLVYPRTIVHGFGDQASARSLLTALRADEQLPPVELVVLTAGALGVLGPDLTSPEQAALPAVLPGRHLDADPAGYPATDAELLLAAAVIPYEGPVAIRSGEAWLRTREPFRAADPGRPVVGAHETLLVTGDRALADRLAGRYGCRVVTADGTDEAALRRAAAGVDAVVHVPAGPDPVAEFALLLDALGDRAPDRRVVLTAPDGTLGACARLARLRGAGRWLALGVPAGGPVDDTVVHTALASAAHLAQLAVDPAPAPVAVGAAVEAVRRPRPALATAYVAPAAGVETTVTALWTEALGVDGIGADDNFVELGGRSMAAVSLAAAVGAATGVPLPVTAVMEHPTVRLLCAEITRIGGAR